MRKSHLDDLIDFLRFPTISANSEYAGKVNECASWLRSKLQSIGLAAGVHPTAGCPVVLARNQHSEGRRTVLFYGHYDVQPVDPLELWTSPPFEPRIADGIIYARGATDNKGQIMAHILGVKEALERAGDLPVNLIFLIEGEEEIGSPHLEKFLQENRDALRCDVIAVSDSGMVGRGIPTFTYGLRGILALEITVRGPSVDLHSGIYGGAVANPATMLARMIASLHEREGRVAVKGFYDDVKDLEDWERKAWAKLPFDEAELLRVTGARRLAGEAGYSAVERTWARPTAEVNGIGGGYQGPGSKTVIPSSAFAKLTFRLVPDQRAADIARKVKAHLESACPPGVVLEMSGGHCGEPYLTDINCVDSLAAQRALRATFGREPALIREGGSIPIVQTFKKVLGADTLLLGLALPDCRAHAPDENFPIENFEAGIRLNQALLLELAQVKKQDSR
jgi:acetylornithine deacetylase/succinyl-diaminopimelate desuccinylase-like protein